MYGPGRVSTTLQQMPSDSRPKVAVVNGLQDTMDLLEMVLGEAGYDTIAVQARDVRKGIVDLPALARTHGLRAIVYDIAIPYAENWDFLTSLRTAAGADLPPIVVTTTNHRALEAFAGETRAIEIMGKPYDLQALVDAVHRAVRQETT